MKRFIATLAMGIFIFSANLALAGGGSGPSAAAGAAADAAAAARSDQQQTLNSTNIAKGGEGGKGGEANSKAVSGSLSDSVSVSSVSIVSEGTEIPREFIGLPGGPSLQAVFIIPESKDCVAIPPEIFEREEVNSMANGSWLEKKGGAFHGLFHSRIKRSVRVPFKGGSYSTDSVKSLEWDPKKGFPLYPGDKKLGSFKCEGDYGFPSDATLGNCIVDGVEKTDMVEFYACSTERRDPFSSGLAYQGGGGGSFIPGGGNAAGAAAVSGVAGTTHVSADIAYDVELYAVKRAKRVVAPPVVKEQPKAEEPKSKCSVAKIEEIMTRLTSAEKSIAKCDLYGHSNMSDRLNAGKASLEAWYCTDKSEYLGSAIQHFQMGELNNIHGTDLVHYTDSHAIIAESEKWLAGAFHARDGSIEKYWIAPEYIQHEDKQSGKKIWVKTTKHERVEIMKIRKTLERYPTKITVK